ncbi:MAG: TerD family protein [Clostridia bacterium]|jgi:tellurium resistance protein TerD|nr:TerD family protein [Clostridia bacterium]
MAVSLKKGERVNLTKEDGFVRGMIGLGWDTNRYQGSADFDLDLVIFECNAQKRCINEKYMIFYNNPTLADPEGAIVHSGDNRTGAGDGDDETAKIDLSKVNPEVQSIVIAVTIHEAKANNQNFGLVDNAFVRLVDESGKEVLRYDLGEDFSIQTSVVFAEIYRNGDDWKFRAVGEGYEKELVDLCREYDIDVE